MMYQQQARNTIVDWARRTLGHPYVSGSFDCSAMVQGLRAGRSGVAGGRPGESRGPAGECTRGDAVRGSFFIVSWPESGIVNEVIRDRLSHLLVGETEAKTAAWINIDKVLHLFIQVNLVGGGGGEDVAGDLADLLVLPARPR